MSTRLYKACKFCGGSSLTTFQASERMFGMGGSFTYTECMDCKSIQLDEVPDDLARYYHNSDYYSFLPLVPSGLARRVFKKIRMNLFLASGAKVVEPSFGYWFKKLGPGFHWKIADVGCGNGQLLYELYASGFTDLHGFDPFMEKDLAVNEQLHLWKKRLEDSEDQFDLIMMHHAFEHMESPMEILQACYDKLNAKGKVIIRTPVTDAQVWRDKREYWVQLDAPRHLNIPSVMGFDTLARTIGFDLQEVIFDSSAFQFWGTALYEEGFHLDLKMRDKLFSKRELEAWEKKALHYNEEGKGDQVCFFLTKSD
ncbi:class I SAM-dependent methyltransferase [Algoriphagus sp.]|uniref:class I SAM-dependent methyltransferase n=1 Tax=Algoriphagus sp. TaxID=1872435 RepID=UPI003295C8C3